LSLLPPRVLTTILYTFIITPVHSKCLSYIPPHTVPNMFGFEVLIAVSRNDAIQSSESLPEFRSNTLPPSPGGSKLEAVNSSETSMKFYQITRRYFPDDILQNIDISRDILSPLLMPRSSSLFHTIYVFPSPVQLTISYVLTIFSHVSAVYGHHQLSTISLKFLHCMVCQNFHISCKHYNS
jgi:hypothetical protein